MSQAKDFSAQSAQVDAASIAPLPNSEKIYVTGTRDDIRVPMRKITLDETPTIWAVRSIRQFLFMTHLAPIPTPRQR